jgi:hypothetical protein
MAGWTNDELVAISEAEELQLASVRAAGTLRGPVTMWVVRIGDDLYVRSVNGRGSSWFRGVQDRHQAHIAAGDVEKDVDLLETRDGRRRGRRRLPRQVRAPLLEHRAVDRDPRSTRRNAQARPALNGEPIQTRRLGAREVPALGLGCMPRTV